jgi:hypothetical protein
MEDQDILERYPLPIAHEYRQLLGGKDWRSKCRQLVDLLDSSLRYCVVIAVSYYFEGLSMDKQLDQWLVRKLVDPRLEDLPEILKRIMLVYQADPEKLYVKELYSFCYGSEGHRSVELKLVERIVEGFAKPFSTGGMPENDPIRQQELYESYAPLVKELLGKMTFLKNYTLLRMIEPKGGEAWQFHKLMGCEIQEDMESWQEGARPEKSGIALWGGSPQRLLPLHPFALFEECEECSTAFYSPPEELFLYKETKEGEVIYFGLRENSVGLTHRIHSKEMPKVFPLFLHIETWPPGIKLSEELQPLGRVLNWSKLQGLAATQSKDQLVRYGKEKYSKSVYLEREAVEEDLQRFLESEKNGFLVVGDSGTGKTNLFCYLVEKALDNHKDIVLFYNCAELPKEVNLGNIVANQLGKQKDFGTLLDKIEKERGEGEGRFLLVLDALNEYQDPKALLESLWQDVLSEVPSEVYEWFKVVVSCRTEAWRQLERHFKGMALFYQTPNEVEVRLHKFTPEELPRVYERYDGKEYHGYREKYSLRSEFTQLSEATKRFMADPLMLKLVAESYRGQVLPEDPKTVEVFERYLREKVGDKADPEMDKLEKQFVKHLVELMYQAKTDELVEKDLWDDEQIGQAVIASTSLSSPYFRLLDKGILMQVKVGGMELGGAELFGDTPTPAKTKIRFTYDRFFEYLLAFFVLPGEVTQDRVKKLAAEANQTHYASLWGAVKTRLIAYIEQDPSSLSMNSVLTALAKEEELKAEELDDTAGLIWRNINAASVQYALRGLLVDTLVSYGSLQSESVRHYFSEILLQLGSEQAGLVAIFAAYHLRIPEVFETAYKHPSLIVRQVAIQYTFFLWSRFREQGEIFLDQLTQKASSEVKHAFPRELLRSIAREELDLQRLPLLSAFLGVTLLVTGHLLSEPSAVKRFFKNFVDLYNSFGPFKNFVAAAVKRWAGEAAIKGWRSGGVINIDTLGIFTRRPLNDPLRQEVKLFAPYMGIDQRSISQLADQLFEWSKIGDGVISLVLIGILVNRSIYEPEETLILLKRMFTKGNAMSQYNVMRSMSSAMQRELNPCTGYQDFFDEAILDIWKDKETSVEIEGKRYGLGHLQFPMVFECQKKDHGKLEFVDRFLVLPWEGDRFERLVILLKNVELAIDYSFRASAFKPYSMLETLSQWFHVENLTPAQQERLSALLGSALASVWRAFPREVGLFLDNEPEMLIHMYEAIRKQSQGLLTNLAGQGIVTSIVLLPAALPGLVKVLENICEEGVEIEKVVRKIGSFFIDPETIEDILRSVESG